MGNNYINIVDGDCPTGIIITQPITTVVDVITAGPKGDKGDKGVAGDTTFFIATGSVTASVHLNGDIFTITSASIDLFSVNSFGALTIPELLLTPQAAPPSPIEGGFFFSTDGDFYLGS